MRARGAAYPNILISFADCWNSSFLPTLDFPRVAACPCVSQDNNHHYFVLPHSPKNDDDGGWF